MKRRMIASTLALVMLLVSIACTGCSTADTPSGTRTVTDMAGRTVEIPETIEHIACQSSTCEAVVISLGKAPMLVGTTDYTDEESLAYRLFPELSQVAKLADDMSVEQMLENNVQVVLVKDTNKIEKYEEAGLPVIYVDLDTIEGTKEGIQIIGEVIGAAEQARCCVEYINDVQKLVEERFENSDRGEYSAYYSRAKYEDSNLLTTYAASHIYSEWIGISGGTVITKDMELAETKGGVMINGEELVSADPDVIFVGGYYRNSVYNEALTGEYSEVLQAVQNRNIYMVPTSVTDWSVGSCELGLTTLWCAQLVAPDLFTDVDMTDEVISFYKDVAGIEVSTELANAILNSSN